MVVEENAPAVDPGALDALVERLRSEQNLVRGLVFGLVAAAMGAALWALVTIGLGWQIGFMAIGVGLLVGYGVRLGGRGIDRTYGFLGAGLALLGCLAGNAITVNYLLSQMMNAQGVPGDLTLGMVLSGMFRTFGFIDIIFYVVAVYEGYHFAFRRVSDEEMASTLAR